MPKKIAALFIISLLVLCLQTTAFSADRTAAGDWRNDVIYFLLTDRFYDGNPDNNGLPPVFDPQNGWARHGGDFAGLTAKLDYIKDLGCTAIWITPVQKNLRGAYHGYHIQDFMKVDSHLGTMEELQNLIKNAHEKGIKVFLDIVCNHTGNMLETVGGNEYNPEGYELRYRNSDQKPLPPEFQNLNWYHNHGGIPAWKPPFQIKGEIAGLDDLKTELPEVREAFIKIYKYWMDVTGCDGFRVDTVKHIEKEFWEEFIPAIKEHAEKIGRDNFIIFGEFLDANENAGDYTYVGFTDDLLFPSMLNFSLYFALRDVFCGEGEVKTLHFAANSLMAVHPAARKQMVNFVDNHDHRRFLSYETAGTDKLKTALALVFAYPGVPCVYYGTEQGFNGADDPKNREDMFAGQFEEGPSIGDNFNENSELYIYIKNLTQLRKKHPELIYGEFNELYYPPEGNGIYSYKRELTDRNNWKQTLIIIFNISSEPKEIPAEISLDGYEMDEASTDKGESKQLAPFSWRLYYKN